MGSVIWWEAGHAGGSVREGKEGYVYGECELVGQQITQDGVSGRVRRDVYWECELVG